MYLLGRESPQLRGCDRLISREQPAIGGNDLHAKHSRRRPRKAAGVRQLAAKVETTQEGERLVQWDRPALLELECEREPAPSAQQELGALAPAVGRRQQEDSRWRRLDRHA